MEKSTPLSVTVLPTPAWTLKLPRLLNVGAEESPSSRAAPVWALKVASGWLMKLALLSKERGPLRVAGPELKNKPPSRTPLLILTAPVALVLGLANVPPVQVRAPAKIKPELSARVPPVRLNEPSIVERPSIERLPFEMDTVSALDTVRLLTESGSFWEWVTVIPGETSMVTSSDAPGTMPPLQFEPVSQSPPAGLLHCTLESRVRSSRAIRSHPGRKSSTALRLRRRWWRCVCPE